ncbi:hypothetical protein GCM10010124_23980 [Pilimelia terevasa]|uniref:DUF393 domain-containing protein n=1 Tax=Pilimelia terevasa TaxID=53372 RepID=A0A8J3BMT0_9ACTN|nr:DCC1-like thiol-disulfide oxidoreductase family protein [Pilimelia terevasa]GGK30404.1 hypothetical protein GCM10010124_23980 [Pilimelia terevasa]
MAPDLALLVYDGDCGFCTRCVEFARAQVRPQVRMAPWQQLDLAAWGLTRAQCLAAAQWCGTDGGRAAGPVAIAHALRTAPNWWRHVGALLAAAPVRWLAWPVYRVVARHRHRLPGGTAACALPERDSAGPPGADRH